MPRRSQLLLTATTLLALVAVAGCGGTDHADGTTTTSPSDRSTTTAAAREPVPSPGCRTATAGTPVLHDKRTIDVGGTERWYLLSTPPGRDPSTPLPLVVDFHGLAEGAEVHSKMSSYAELGQRDGFVVAQPNGTGAPVAWKVALQDNPDLTFVDAMLDRIGQDACIDTSRVYATGLSNGAFISSTIACADAGRFAAVAPVAGVTFPEGCQTDRPVPVLAFHGTADPILYFNGGVGDLGGLMAGRTTADQAKLPPADLEGAGYPANVRSWAAHNGCDPTPKDTHVSPTVVHRVYTCPSGADVEFYVLEGGGHSWPGSTFSQGIAKIVGPTNTDVDATALTWDFFQRFSLPAS